MGCGFKLLLKDKLLNYFGNSRDSDESIDDGDDFELLDDNVVTRLVGGIHS